MIPLARATCVTALTLLVAFSSPPGDAAVLGITAGLCVALLLLVLGRRLPTSGWTILLGMLLVLGYLAAVVVVYFNVDSILGAVVLSASLSLVFAYRSAGPIDSPRLALGPPLQASLQDRRTASALGGIGFIGIAASATGTASLGRCMLAMLAVSAWIHLGRAHPFARLWAYVAAISVLVLTAASMYPFPVSLAASCLLSLAGFLVWLAAMRAQNEQIASDGD